jgi:hypothetical protein
MRAGAVLDFRVEFEAWELSLWQDVKMAFEDRQGSPGRCEYPQGSPGSLTGRLTFLRAVIVGRVASNSFSR